MTPEQQVRVRLKVGDVEVEIVTSDLEMLEKAVHRVIAAARSAVAATPPAPPTVSTRVAGRRRGTCRDLILELVEEGFFDQERNLGEVWERLRVKGYTYDRTAVAHALLDLVREGVLVREGRPRSFVYRRRSTG
ncbi:hypothetical protein DRN94_000820 [archaeon]|nr:hypothetical protein [archaeon]